MSEKLYITLSGNSIQEIEKNKILLKDAHPNHKWVEKTEIYATAGDFLVDGKMKTERFFIQKLETE